MAEGFDIPMDDFEKAEAERIELEKKKLAFDKIFSDVYHTPAGKRMFDTLKERFMSRQIAHIGDGMDQIFERQGQYNLVEMMFRCVNDVGISEKK